MNPTDNPSPAADESPGKVSESQRYLVFSLSQETYAIPLLQVKEVIGYSETTPIPYAPSYFKGVINLRGQVISVMDLRTKLKLTKANFGAKTSIIILNLAPLCLGVIVDSINCVLALKPSELSPAPEVESPEREGCLTNIARKDEKLILLLDIENTLNVEDRKALKHQGQNQAA